jgi:hypothetical protein
VHFRHPDRVWKYFIENNYRSIVFSESIELFLIAWRFLGREPARCRLRKSFTEKGTLSFTTQSLVKLGNFPTQEGRMLPVFVATCRTSSSGSKTSK